MPKASKGGVYAVAKGHVPGIYASWDECQRQVNGFKGCRHQKFSSVEQARAFLAEHGVSVGNVPPSSSSAVAATSAPSARAKPYARPPPSSTSAKKEAGNNPRSSRWAALSTEAIQDESGWDVVYSDGACKGNGKVGSIAGVGVWWGHNDARNLAERCPGAQTNNRAELIAIVRVLETTPWSKRPLLIKTDSKYSISCFREWMPKWLENGFKSSTGQPVKNAPLIRYLSALLDSRARLGQKVHLQYVKGHAGIEGNEGADQMANLGAIQPEMEERDWDALIAKVDAEVDDVPAKSSSKTSAVPTIGPTQEDLEAFAQNMLNDDELLAELAAS